MVLMASEQIILFSNQTQILGEHQLFVYLVIVTSGTQLH